MQSRVLLILPALALLVLLGCATPAERAEKLFQDGQYEEVLKRYPNEPAAARAKEALAAKLMKDGDFARVIAEYQDTQLYAEARNRLAEKLLSEGNYDEVLSKFPDSPAAIRAREMAAQALFDAGRVTEAARDYPQTSAGQTARTEIARAEYDRIMTFKDQDERRKLLENFITNSLYTGTSFHASAQLELAKLDGLKLPGNY